MRIRSPSLLPIAVRGDRIEAYVSDASSHATSFAAASTRSRLNVAGVRTGAGHCFELRDQLQRRGFVADQPDEQHAQRQTAESNNGDLTLYV
jgi:hypothetical protein